MSKKQQKIKPPHPTINTALVEDVKLEFESRSITPTTVRPKGNLENEFIILKEYGLEKSSTNVKRFSIKPNENLIGTKVLRQELHELEKNLFLKAVEELDKNTLSAEKVLMDKVFLKPSVKLNNIVLVDIFERNKDKNKDKVIDSNSDVHTVCLWKMTDETILLIDPSSTSISSYLESPLQKLVQNFKIIIHAHASDKFYFSSPESPGEYRDCIDIAVKIALALNEATMNTVGKDILNKGVENVIQDILQSINSLSNRNVLNEVLGKTRENTNVKELQSSDPETREKMLELFRNTKEVAEFTTTPFAKLTELEITDIKEKIDRNKEILTLKKVKVTFDYLDQLDKAHEKVMLFNKELALVFPTLQVKLSLKETSTIEDSIIVNKEKSQTGLHLAAMDGDDKAFKAILEEYQSIKLKPFISAVDSDGQTALHLAAARGYSQIVESLILVMEPEEIAKKTNDWQYTPLHMAVRGSGDPRAIFLIVKSILDKAPKIAGCSDKANQTALHLAASSGNREAIECLLHHMGTDEINKADVGWKGYTALHVAIHSGNNEIVKLLLAEPAASELVGATDIYGQTALHWAPGRIDDETIKLLITKMTPADIQKKSTSGNLARDWLKGKVGEEVISLLDEKIVGKGFYDYESSSYWQTYTKVAMDKLLHLRLKSISMDEDVEVISPDNIFDGTTESAKRLAMEIGPKIKDKVLVNLNLYNKHWVGIVIDKGENEINLHYMDSEQQKMPAVLKEKFLETLSRVYPDYQLGLIEDKLEQQKYNNCGLEVIENFICYLTSQRLSQDDASPIHSLLFEESLLLGDTAIC